FRLIAPSGTSETERRSTAGAQAPRGCSSFSAIWPPLAGCRQRLGLARVEGNRFVEAGEVENLPVVVVQAIGEKLLLLALGANEQGDQQTDAGAVHVLQLAEVENNGPRRLIAGFGVGVHEHVFGEGGDLSG